MSNSIGDILNKNTDDVVERQGLPDGEYRFRIMSYKGGNVKNDKATPFVRLNLRPIEVIQADSDVDLSNVDSVQHDHWMSEKSEAITLRWFKQTLGMDTTGKSWREIFEEAIGAEFAATVEVKMEGQNKDRPTPRIKAFRRAEAA